MPGTLIGARDSAENGVDKHVYVCGACPWWGETDRYPICPGGAASFPLPPSSPEARAQKERPTPSKGMQSDSSRRRGAVLYRVVREGVSNKPTFG